MILLIDTDKALHNLTHHHKENSQQIWNNNNFLDLIKDIYKKPIN